MTAAPLPSAPGRHATARTDSVGRNEWGTITIADTVVGKVAAQAAVEHPDAGGAAPRVLGRSLAGAARFGARDTSLSSVPRASAKVDGTTARVEIALSVRWPASIGDVTEGVRQSVRTRVAELTGMQVLEVTIRVIDLVTTSPKTGRVR